jgi:hypothetical protein
VVSEGIGGESVLDVPVKPPIPLIGSLAAGQEMCFAENFF